MDAEHLLPVSIFMDIDRSGPVPLYYQIASRIEAAIVDGTVPAGARIDNEIALGERLGISRPTIRRAIQDLVDKGLLVRRRGIGTQVVHGEVTRKVELTSLFEDLSSADRSPSTRILERREIAATTAIASRLGVEPRSPILHVRRVRLAENVPLALLENYLPEEFLDISESDLADFGLYQLLSARGVDIRVARQRIGARPAHRPFRIRRAPRDGPRAAAGAVGRAPVFRTPRCPRTGSAPLRSLARRCSGTERPPPVSRRRRSRRRSP